MPITSMVTADCMATMENQMEDGMEPEVYLGAQWDNHPKDCHRFN